MTDGTSTKPLVLVVQGSASDTDRMVPCLQTLNELSIPYSRRILSAHRTPVEADEAFAGAETAGCKVIIAAAGVAAHLAGAAAARSLLPVIGVPLDGGPLQGLDALLSTVQMPPGIPVGTVAIGKQGAKNAALLAARIVALVDEGVRARLGEYGERQRLKVLEADAAIAEDGEGGAGR